jgi:thiamine phosphate synthase YjbQ (UPF0047 family)
LDVTELELFTKEIRIKTKGNNDIKDITPLVGEEIKRTGLKEGNVTLFVVGSTGAPLALEKFAPYMADYEHHKTWGDRNGSAHVRAAIMGPSLVVPFSDQRLLLGTWQQIALFDFDTHPRERRVIIQIMGAA